MIGAVSFQLAAAALTFPASGNANPDLVRLHVVPITLKLLLSPRLLPSLNEELCAPYSEGNSLRCDVQNQWLPSLGNPEDNYACDWRNAHQYARRQATSQVELALARPTAVIVAVHSVPCVDIKNKLIEHRTSD